MVVLDLLCCAILNFSWIYGLQMIEKAEFCSAEIIVNWCSPIRLLSIQNQVEKWLEIPHFCCHFAATFAIFVNVALWLIVAGLMFCLFPLDLMVKICGLLIIGFFVWMMLRIWKMIKWCAAKQQKITSVSEGNHITLFLNISRWILAAVSNLASQHSRGT